MVGHGARCYSLSKCLQTVLNYGILGFSLSVISFFLPLFIWCVCDIYAHLCVDVHICEYQISGLGYLPVSAFFFFFKQAGA